MTERRESPESARPDPLEAWRQFYEASEQAWGKAMKDLYEANEQSWTKAIKDVTTTNWYAEAQGKMLETFLAFQKAMRDGMTAQLGMLNLPTRDDVARLGELIVGLEEKVDQLDDRAADLEERLTRRVDERLAGFEKRLARQLDERLGRLEDSLTREAQGAVESVRGRAVPLATRTKPKRAPGAATPEVDREAPGS